MILQRHLAIRRFDVLRLGSSWHAEHLVIIVGLLVLLLSAMLLLLSLLPRGPLLEMLPLRLDSLHSTKGATLAARSKLGPQKATCE